MDRDDDPAALAAPAGTPVPLRRNRNFRLLWIGQVLSDLGSEFGILAYPLLVLALTHSPIIAGVIGTVTAVVAFVVRLPAGALADRFDRRRTMIACDGIRAVLFVLFAIGVLTHSVSWPIVMVVAVIDRIGDTLFSPASVALLPSLVDDTQLERSWAATEARQYAASLSGPALGGVLYTAGRAVPFIGDAISYGISALASVAMKGDFQPRVTAEKKSLWRESLAGVRVVWEHPLLRAVMFQAPLINFGVSGVIFTITIALRNDGKSATVIGLTQAAITVGALVGALIAPLIQGKWPLSRLVVAITASGTLCFAGAAFLLPSPLVACPVALVFFLTPTSNAALLGSMLRETPDEMRGRVSNVIIQVATGLAAVAPLVAGLLVAEISSRVAMLSFAAALAVSTILAITLKGLREAEAATAPEPTAEPS